MATTRSDLVVPEVLADAIQAEFAGKLSILGGSGAAVVANGLPSNKGGDTVKVPYFDALGEMEDVAEDVALTPEDLTMSNETATVIHAGKAVEISEWARMAAQYADPYAELARQFRVLAERRADAALLTAATAALPGGNSLDRSAAATPTITYDHMVDAKMVWGDEHDNVALIGMHSKVYGDALKLADTTGRPLLIPKANDGDFDRFVGMPVRVSDRNTIDAVPTPDEYHTLLIKRGALALWYAEAPRVLFDVDVLKDNEVLAIHMYFAAHRYLRPPGSSKPGVVRLITQ